MGGTNTKHIAFMQGTAAQRPAATLLKFLGTIYAETDTEAVYVSRINTSDGSAEWMRVLDADAPDLTGEITGVYAIGGTPTLGVDLAVIGTPDLGTDTDRLGVVHSEGAVIGNDALGGDLPASTALYIASADRALRLPVCANTAAITSPIKGHVIYDDAADKLKFYNGSAWETITSA
jgi:hypothetical protein